MRPVIGCILDPGGAIAGPVDPSANESRPPGHAPESTCIFSPPVPGCLASGKSITPSLATGHSDDQSPIDFARRPAGEGFGEMARRPGAPRHQQGARRVLIEAMDQFRPRPVVIGEAVEQAIEMAIRSWFRPASPGPAACSGQRRAGPCG